MKQRHSVIPRTLCFVYMGDEVLFIKAGDAKEWAGTYNPVGGHIEKGESIIDAAEREIQEESGLKVSKTKLKGVVHVSGFFGKDVMMFVTESFSDTKKITESSEGSLVWKKLNEIDNLKLFEDMHPLIKALKSLKPDEMFYGVSEYDGKDKLLSINLKTV